MVTTDPNERELLDLGRDKFNVGEFKQAEAILSQVLMKNNRIPEVYQMLATIYYDQGKFSRAIQNFKRALEVDPTYTDASVGLSIVLNDLGKYDEGRQAFDQAQKVAQDARKQVDPFIQDKLAQKHLELGEMYLQHSYYDDAIDQFYKALKYSVKKTDISIKLVDVFVKKEDHKNAIRELKNLIRENPHFIPARLKLGAILYTENQVHDAVEQWEGVLLRDPENPEAKNYLKIAQRSGYSLNL